MHQSSGRVPVKYNRGGFSSFNEDAQSTTISSQEARDQSQGHSLRAEIALSKQAMSFYLPKSGDHEPARETVHYRKTC